MSGRVAAIRAIGFGIMLCGAGVGEIRANAVQGTLAGVVRHYRFRDAATLQRNLASDVAEMTHRPDGDAALVTCTGRVEGARAVLLDGDAFMSPPLTLPTNAISVAVWIKPMAQGTKRVQHAVNGMIATSGSGYNDGWRLLVTDWTARRVAFQIGRARGAFSLTSMDTLSAGAWNHVAATWDGVCVRLYVNGMFSSGGTYEGDWVSPKAPLFVGFAGFGVGSLRMGVDEITVFDRALTPLEVARLALAESPLPATAHRLIVTAQHAAQAAPGVRARQAYQQVADDAAFPEAWRHWAQLAATRFMKDGAELRLAAQQCAGLFDAAGVPAMVRAQATEHLIQVCRRGYGAELPSAVLRQLPERVMLDAADQRCMAEALARAYLREKQSDAALQVLSHLVKTDAGTPGEEIQIRHLLAQTHWQAGAFEAARSEYVKLAEDTRFSEALRGVAALSVAQVWQAEGKLEQAMDAYRAVTGKVTTLTYLLDEAKACAAACARGMAGEPLFDPEASRQRLAPLPEPAIRYFVAPRGRDSNPGTIKAPFATLTRARDAIRARRAKGPLPRGGACVYVRGGHYRVTGTLLLETRDSGSYGAPVVYRAWKNERPVFDGGFRVRGFRKAREKAVLARLPDAARGKVYVADLKRQGYRDVTPQAGYGRGQSNQCVRELFQDGKPLTIARWPNDAFLTMADVDITNLTFTCQTNRIQRWTQADDLMVNGYWLHLWSESTVPLASLDTTNGCFTFTAKPEHNLRAGYPFRVLNVLEEIDQPGEWFLDRANNKLYVWPHKHPWFSRLVLSCWDKPFIMAKEVNDLVIRGLTFTYGKQHGVVLERCVNTTFAGNAIRCLGGTALTVDNGANIRIYGNQMQVLGHSGMRVSGGNRTNLASGRIVIENNDVGAFARCSRTYNPAVHFEGCGLRVAHNRFHHANSSAMRIDGNDCLIEYNLVEQVVQESDDQGGLDMWGNPSYRGVMIRYNIWRDIGSGHAPCGQAGIRFDDAICGIVVYGNRFERSSTGQFGGVQIHGGNLNIIDNNLFTDCRYGVSFSPWGEKRWKAYLDRKGIQAKIYETVDIRLPPYSTAYPELSRFPGRADINRVSRNLFVGVDRVLHKAPAGTEAWENQQMPTMPDLAQVSAHSPFRPLPPQEAIGVYDDSVRAVGSEP